jgi:hypothetical protein
MTTTDNKQEADRITSGSYPIRRPLTIAEVEALLATAGYVEFRCDELPAREEGS